MKNNAAWLVVILILTGFSVWVALPAATKGVQLDNTICIDYARDHTIVTGDTKCTESIVLDFGLDGKEDFRLNIQQSLGLDLVGGLRVLLQADLPPGSFTPDDLKKAADNVSRRVNALGLTEATIQVQGNNRILVELPGVRDREQAINTIQQTALLEFVDFSGLRNQAESYTGQKIYTTERAQQDALRQTPDGAETDTAALMHPTTGQPFRTILTGACLQAASATYAASQQGGVADWFIEFKIKNEGDCIQTFATETGRLTQEPMAIVLDSEVLSAPIVQQQLSDGGIIQGSFDQERAATLALQLRSGALPIPLSVISAEEVGATLGQESVAQSIKAGVIGVVIVLTFMLVYYRAAGVAADLALLVFIALNLALFKLIPVTLTLPAITGFLISIGTAVDGNILIFERIKEELRAGRPLREALGLGFDRAWTSIRDSNLSTIIICGILFLFGQTPGASIVSGFAVTLALGLIVNLFTAVVATRTFIYLIVNLAHDFIAARKWLMGV